MSVNLRLLNLVDVKLKGIERYDLNFVTGLINTVEERDINEVVIGLHRRSSVVDTFFGGNLLCSTCRKCRTIH